MDYYLKVPKAGSYNIYYLENDCIATDQIFILSELDKEYNDNSILFSYANEYESEKFYFLNEKFLYYDIVLKTLNELMKIHIGDIIVSEDKIEIIVPKFSNKESFINFSFEELEDNWKFTVNVDDPFQSIVFVNRYIKQFNDSDYGVTLVCPKCKTPINVSVSIETCRPNIRINLDEFSKERSKFYTCEKCKQGLYLKHYISIDTPMVSIINKLNNKGYHTLACCSGHSLSEFDMYIMFSNLIQLPESSKLLLKNSKLFDLEDLDGHNVIRSKYLYYDYNSLKSKLKTVSNFREFRNIYLEELNKIVDDMISHTPLLSTI